MLSAWLDWLTSPRHPPASSPWPQPALVLQACAVHGALIFFFLGSWGSKLSSLCLHGKHQISRDTSQAILISQRFSSASIYKHSDGTEAPASAQLIRAWCFLFLFLLTITISMTVHGIGFSGVKVSSFQETFRSSWRNLLRNSFLSQNHTALFTDQPGFAPGNHSQGYSMVFGLQRHTDLVY